MTTIQKEFPDFDRCEDFARLLDRLAPFGAEDSSWHNDVAPSILLTDIPESDVRQWLTTAKHTAAFAERYSVRVWLDYADTGKREFDFDCSGVQLVADDEPVTGFDISCSDVDAIVDAVDEITDANRFAR